MRSLEIRLLSAPDDAELRVEVAGYLDASTVAQLDDFLKRSFVEGKKHLSLRIQDLVYLSSAGIGLFVEWANRVRGRGEMALVNPTDKVFKTLELLGFTRLLKIVCAAGESNPTQPRR